MVEINSFSTFGTPCMLQMAARSGNEFGRNLLIKCGWKEGKGLGRNENGISKPIKASMKFDKTGIGHNVSEEFTYPWWDHLFNSTASSIVVENSEEGVEVMKVTDVDISTKKPLDAKLKRKKMYGGFVKSGTLFHNDKVEDDSLQHVDEVKSPDHIKLSDEEVFKRCGGLTGHKAARHGHRLSGKLKRLLAQEGTLLSADSKDGLESKAKKEEELTIRKRRKKKKTK